MRGGEETSNALDTTSLAALLQRVLDQQQDPPWRDRPMGALAAVVPQKPKLLKGPGGPAKIPGNILDGVREHPLAPLDQSASQQSAMPDISKLATPLSRGSTDPSVPSHDPSDDSYVDRLFNDKTSMMLIMGGLSMMDAGSQPGANLGSSLAHGLGGALQYLSGQRSAEAAQQQAELDREEKQREYSDKRGDEMFDRQYKTDTLKALTEDRTADNERQAAQDQATQDYRNRSLGIDQQRVGIDAQRAEIDLVNADRMKEHDKSESQAKADDNYNDSFKNYMNVGKTYDPLTQEFVDTPGQKPLTLQQVRENAARENPTSTQAKQWAIGQLQWIAQQIRQAGDKTAQEQARKHFAARTKHLFDTYAPNGN